MNVCKMFLQIAAAGVLTLSLSKAHAQDLVSMVVLVDASGSMGAIRPVDGLSRFEAAQTRTANWVTTLAANPAPTEVAVFTFRNDATAQSQTPGFVSPTDAVAAIQGLSGPGGLTPLAGSLCDAINLLISRNTPGNRILILGSDGLENNTPSTHPCFGPTSTTDMVPYSLGSWQNLVYTSAIANVVVQVELFDNSGVLGSFLGILDTEQGSPFMAFGLDGAPTLLQFATALAEDSGGTVTVVQDNAPVPVFGDYNGDGCVATDDATDLIQSLGQTVPPGNPAYDLNADGVIDVNDYVAWASNIGNGCS